MCRTHWILIPMNLHYLLTPAKAIYNYLVGRGIDSNRLKYVGYGRSGSVVAVASGNEIWAEACNGGADSKKLFIPLGKKDPLRIRKANRPAQPVFRVDHRGVTPTNF